MESREILESVSSHIKTTSRAYQFLYEIDKVNENMYKSTDKQVSEVIKNSMSVDNSLFVINYVQGMDVVSTNEFLLQLSEIIKKLPQFKMILSFWPDEKFAETLYTWVRENIGKNYIIDVEVDQEVIGGGVFVHNGHYKDHSLRKQLKSFFENKDAIKELI